MLSPWRRSWRPFSSARVEPADGGGFARLYHVLSSGDALGAARGRWAGSPWHGGFGAGGGLFHSVPDRVVRLGEHCRRGRTVFFTGMGVFMCVVGELYRRARQKALSESEERLRTLGNNLPGGAIYQHLQQADGRVRYVYMSAGIEKILGMKAESAMADADAFRQLIVEEDRPRCVAAEGKSAREMTPFDCEFRQRTVTGEVKWVHCRSTPRQLENGAILWDGVVTDITERRRIEARIVRLNRELEQKLHELEAASVEQKRASEQRWLAMEAGELGAWDYHLDTGEVAWDERCRDMWGIAQGGQIDYGAAINRIHAEDRAGVDLAIKQALAGAHNGEYETEFRVVKPNGSEHWIASHGRVYFEGEGPQRRAVRFVGINREITQKKRAETVLQTTLQRFYDVLSNMSCAVLLVSDEGRVEFANQAVCDQFALEKTPAELVGIASPDMLEILKGSYLQPEGRSRASAQSLSGENG